jgi:hypothetical protein
MTSEVIQGGESASPCRDRRRRVVLCLSVGLLAFTQPASVSASAQDKPLKGRIRLYVAANTERAAAGQVSRQVDVDESANEVRKRAKGLDWVQLVDRPEDADLVVTLTGRRKDPNRGFVLSYVLESGEHKMEGDFASEGGTEITGGTRALGSDGRTNYEGRQSRSWEELAKQFARSLENFAKANYDRILRGREPR